MVSDSEGINENSNLMFPLLVTVPMSINDFAIVVADVLFVIIVFDARCTGNHGLIAVETLDGIEHIGQVIFYFLPAASAGGPPDFTAQKPHGRKARVKSDRTI